MAELRLDGVTKTYAGGVTAVKNVNLTVADGELLVLVGPSGCGKSTILRMISGLESLTEGRIFLNDRKIDEVRESARDIAMIFQNYALYPHLSVYNNIGFPLKLAKVAKDERDRRVREVAQTLGLTAYLNVKPGQLSGGQRQRVAMGRAIVRHPQVFLMDEPLSNLDAKLRAEMRTELLAMQRRLGTTTIYVTHDQAEAMTLGDRVAVLNNGALMQVGTPDEIYAQPDHLFVAGCLGSPTINTLPARLATSGGAFHLHYGDQHLQLDQEEMRRHNVQAGPDRAVIIGVRPEALRPAGAPAAQDGGRLLTGTVMARESLGSDLFVFVELKSAGATSGEDEIALARESPADSARIRPEGRVVARFPADSVVTEGERIRLAVAPDSLHLFDPETGVAWARVGAQISEPDLAASAVSGPGTDSAR
ncbi:MAG TPA: sn-glycerol-3-phosphate ABC transporter ATP-binding protein UgpC [Streptosporangiaceae bacterium]|nr:sn-glycerol-3-phosphate ABC transporter ATP-binding protein UgpC [Streptosporangiaceae bacterium]